MVPAGHPIGGRGNDRLDGGLGPDYLSGQDEKDTVTYEDRTNQVFVTLDGRDNDGEKGATTSSDVEVILGGFEATTTSTAMSATTPSRAAPARTS